MLCYGSWLGGLAVDVTTVRAIVPSAIVETLADVAVVVPMGGGLDLVLR